MIKLIVSFLACLLILVQITFIYFQGDGFCLNEGCKIVDTFTTVPLLFFNSAGLFYFLFLLLCFYKSLNDSEFWRKFAELLLLAGIAAEGVLVFFQHSIVTVYCSYCLIVFSVVVLLNILCGLRQCIYAGVIFTAVIVAFAGLQFRVAGQVKSLDAGTIVKVMGSQKDKDIYFFFSSSCPHCEEIIAGIKKENSCSISFNPVEKFDSFVFSGAKQFVHYDPEVNLAFLKQLSLKEIPVLLEKRPENMRILVGESQIESYLNENCRSTSSENYSGSTDGQNMEYDGLSFTDQQTKDRCSVTEDCPDSPGKRQ